MNDAEYSDQALAQLEAAHAELPDYIEDVLGPKTQDYCIVVPVINEGDRFQSQLKRMAATVTKADIIVVDGGSIDGSVELDFLRTCGVRARLTKTGPGKLSAQLRIAYHWALTQGYRGIVTIDGNGKDGVEAIDTMCERLSEGHDFVQGSRYAPGGQAINTPRARWIVGRFLFAPLISLAGGFWYSEMTNGFRAYSRRLLLDPKVSPFRNLFNNYNLLFYLSVRAPQLGYRVSELGVRRGYPDDGKVPTKISGLSGQAALTLELLRAAMGAFHQGPTGTGVGLIEYDDRWAKSLSILVFLVFIGIAGSTAFQGVNPYVDEAMLAENYLTIRPTQALKPLPLYQQAAPVGYSAIAATVVQMTGHAIGPLRWLSFAAVLLAAVLLYRALALLRSTALAPIALAVMLLSPLMIAHSVGVKHYSFEVLSTALGLFGAAYALSRFDRFGFAVFAICLAMSALLAIPAAIIVGALGGGMILHVATRAPDLSHNGALRTTVIGVLLASLCAVAWHTLIHEPIIRSQFTAFADVYDNRGPTLWPLDLDPLVRLTKLLFGAFWPMGRPTSTTVEALSFGMILIGVLVSLRKQPFVALSFISFCAIALALTLIGAFPKLQDRQLLFMAPIVAILWALGLVTLMRWALFWYPSARNRPRQFVVPTTVAAVVALAFGATFAVKSLPSLERQQLSPLVRAIEDSAASKAPVFVFFSAQPGLAVMSHNLGELIGTVDATSTTQGWAAPYRRYVRQPNGNRSRVLTEEYLSHAANEMAGQQTMWLIATHLRSGPDLDPLIELTDRIVGPCQEYRRSRDSILYFCD